MILKECGSETDMLKDRNMTCSFKCVNPFVGLSCTQVCLNSNRFSWDERCSPSLSFAKWPPGIQVMNIFSPTAHISTCILNMFTCKCIQKQSLLRYPPRSDSRAAECTHPPCCCLHTHMESISISGCICKAQGGKVLKIEKKKKDAYALKNLWLKGTGKQNWVKKKSNLTNK